MRTPLFVPALLLAAFTGFSQPAAAQTVLPPQPVLDEVMLELSAEAWVEAAEARVVVVVNAAGTGSNAGTVREDILDALGRLAKDAEWRFTSFNRSLDRTGMEQWRAVAEARMPDAALDGLADRAKQSSRPGMQIELSQTDFSPTLAELETVRAQLRAEIYARVREELKRLNDAFADRDFRVAGISFGQFAVPEPRMMRAQMAMMDSAESAPARGVGGVAVANKLTQSATVRLSAFAKQPE